MALNDVRLLCRYLAGCQKCVDRGLWDKRIFEFRKKGYNTNPIIMQNLYWVLGLFGKENIVHGMLQ